MFIGWSQERKDGEAEGRYYHGDDGWLHRAMVLHGRGHVVRVFQTVTERMVTFSVELRGTFYVSTDGTAADPFETSDAAASALLLAAIAQRGGRGADGESPPPRVSQGPDGKRDGEFQPMGTAVEPQVELILHDATYVHKFWCDAQSVGIEPSSMEIIDGAYRRLGGVSDETWQLLGSGCECSWPAIVPECLKASRILHSCGRCSLAEQITKNGMDGGDDGVFGGRDRRWCNPRFPEPQAE